AVMTVIPAKAGIRNPCARRHSTVIMGPRFRGDDWREISNTMTQPHQLLHPRAWKQPKGFANGIAAEGRLVFLAGQVGWNAEQIFESTDFVAQARQALMNIVTLVEEA